MITLTLNGRGFLLYDIITIGSAELSNCYLHKPVRIIIQPEEIHDGSGEKSTKKIDLFGVLQ